MTVATGWSCSQLLASPSLLYVLLFGGLRRQNRSLLRFCRQGISPDSAEHCTGKEGG